MKIDRPLWAAGTLLSPQQFQQQARWEAYTNECIARLALVHPWGIMAAEFDKDALRLGKLKADRICVRFQDGTLLDTERADVLPPALDLTQVLPATAQSATLLLALPLEHANGGNCLPTDAKADRPIRYRQDWASVQDILGNDTESMAVARYALTLRLDGDENGDYLTCPAVRLVRDVQGVWGIDPQFVPPLLQFGAHAALISYLDRLLTQLHAKRTRLMGMRRESNQRMADFAVADVSLFWLLNALNSYEPVLNDFLAHPALHPELVYRELVKLAGALLTFSLEHDMDAIPAYDHARLGAVFPPLFSLISTLLEASLPSRVITLELEKVRPNQWQATLNDPRLREEADFYLSVRSALPAHLLQTQFPLLCKVGAPDDVNNLINVALNGVPLIPLSHVPAAIPLRLENQYFALDLNHPTATAMLASGSCAFYVPGTLSDVQLELYAVLRA
ncbi:type VI secretion system baseplate subunit TssK [Hafnia paralvei]|uniref:type VI secretion system baseplate subunit TssK n=1 Tax=Hafnia paralvei TaxID=546367 RepID=UPI001419C1F3|nr:type VI secretion system baseplate subunit TssK [Hafnia paralvei]NIH30639.1 type VI secretion system baseplate subunit TssK [Hafnia paralvei]UBM42555.1 type VI secretion system baseplate subunit TssK [Hafnia paralvei]